METKEHARHVDRIVICAVLAAAHLIAIVLVLTIMGNGALPTAISFIIFVPMIIWTILAIAELVSGEK